MQEGNLFKGCTQAVLSVTDEFFWLLLSPSKALRVTCLWQTLNCWISVFWISFSKFSKLGFTLKKKLIWASLKRRYYPQAIWVSLSKFNSLYSRYWLSEGGVLVEFTGLWEVKEWLGMTAVRDSGGDDWDCHPKIWILGPALPLSSQMTLGKLCHLTALYFPSL